MRVVPIEPAIADINRLHAEVQTKLDELVAAAALEGLSVEVNAFVEEHTLVHQIALVRRTYVPKS